MQNLKVLEDLVLKNIRLDGKLAIGDITRHTERFRNVLNAENGKFNLMSLALAHALYYTILAALIATSFQRPTGTRHGVFK